MATACSKSARPSNMPADGYSFSAALRPFAQTLSICYQRASVSRRSISCRTPRKHRTALKRRTQALGWDAEQLIVVDEI
jgi:hypothetical protein